MSNWFKKSKPEPTRASKTHIHIETSPDVQPAIRLYWRTAKKGIEESEAVDEAIHDYLLKYQGV